VPWQLLVIEPVTLLQQVGVAVWVRLGCVVDVYVEVGVEEGGRVNVEVGVDVGVGWMRASWTILEV
jgi:hypothetical protein